MKYVHTIYMVTAPNGLKYIGRTNGPLETRWRSHISAAENISRRIEQQSIHQEIAKHGHLSFLIEALASASDIDGAIQTERVLIIQHGTKYPNGLNHRVARSASKSRDIINLRAVKFVRSPAAEASAA